MHTIPIIYASTSGNVESVCEAVADLLNTAGITTSLHRAEATSYEIIETNSTFILATSTWEHGELNPFFNKLYTELLDHDLKGKRAAFIGLGDIRYESVLFCKGIDIIREAFLRSGGTEINTTLRLNGEPYQYLNTAVLNWATRLIELLKNEQS